MPEGELVENRHAERLQMLVQDVLDRPRGTPISNFPREIAVVAAVHVSHDDTLQAVELPRVA